MPRDAIVRALAYMKAESAFATQLSLPASDLKLSVAEVGDLRLPVTTATAKTLITQAERAPYGRRDETLVDLRVRDTWQIPGAKLSACWDEAAWRDALGQIGQDLGLDSNDVLEARLQDMLLYEPGQFFKAHQDSEKDDEMIGTLVVALPTRVPHVGGASIVQHSGHRKTLRAKQAPETINLFAFFADCRHEVQPVTDGHRVVLTYRLHRRSGAHANLQLPASEAGADLRDAVQTFFESPMGPQSPWDRAEPRPPRKLLYLLDHEYTSRGLAAQNLKPTDAARVRALSSVAASLDCEIVLALADVHEQWMCEDESDYGHYGRGRYARYNEEPAADGDHPDLIELVDSDLTLHAWTALGAGAAEDICASVDEREVCHTRATQDCRPYESEHEGFMGNWGNTVDRWYHRAGVLLWPRALSFAIRAEASPAWAVTEVQRQLAAHGMDTARKHTAQILEMWPMTVEKETGKFFTDSLQLAAALKSHDLAAGLLAPFSQTHITPHAVSGIACLLHAYGEAWLRETFEGWRPPHPVYPYVAFERLPTVCADLTLADAVVPARWLLDDEHKSLHSRLQSRSQGRPVFAQDDELEPLTAGILGLLDAALVLEAFEVTDAIVGRLLDDPSLPATVQLLRSAEAQYTGHDLALLGLAPLHGACTEALSQHLALPPRAPTDWALPPPPTHHNAGSIDAELRAFLVAPDRRRLEWPIRKELRQDVHRVLDGHHYPVTHVTHRSGSPYVLVLNKTAKVHTEAAQTRAQAEIDLAWLHQVEARFIP